MSVGDQDAIEKVSTKYFGPHMPITDEPDSSSKNMLCEWYLFYDNYINDDLRYRFRERIIECACNIHNISRDDFMCLVETFRKNKLLIRQKLYCLIDRIIELQAYHELYDCSRFVCEVLCKCLSIIGIKAKIKKGSMIVGDTESRRPHHWIRLDRIIDATYSRSWLAHYAKVSSDYVEEEDINEPGYIERFIITAVDNMRDIYFSMLSAANILKDAKYV